MANTLQHVDVNTARKVAAHYVAHFMPVADLILLERIASIENNRVVAVAIDSKRPHGVRQVTVIHVYVFHINPLLKKH